MTEVPKLKRPPGYYSLAELPQRGSLKEAAFGSDWWELDQIFKFYHGQFVVVTGKPGHGKSTFMLNLLARMAKRKGVRSFLYVPENEGYLFDKLMGICGKDEKFEYFAQTQCFVQSSVPEAYNDSPQTIWWILDCARYAVEHDKVEIIYIDPWNEIEQALMKGQSLTDYVRECLMALKQFARCYNVSIIMVAHPTKAALEEEKIGLAHIESSASWYNKADNGLIVVREAERPNVCKVISAKVRERGAGKLGACYFQVDPETEIFTPLYGGVDVGGV